MGLPGSSALAFLIVFPVCHGSGADSQASPSKPRGTVVTGTVLDSAGMRPVYPSRVDLLGSTAFALCDTLGQFVLSAVPQGQRVLRVRGIGFLPRDLSIVAKGDTLRLRPIRLRPDRKL